MDTWNLCKYELAVRMSKTLWSKGDMDWTQEPLETFSHWPWGHIPKPKDRFLKRNKNILKYPKNASAYHFHFYITRFSRQEFSIVVTLMAGCRHTRFWLTYENKLQHLAGGQLYCFPTAWPSLSGKTYLNSLALTILVNELFHKPWNCQASNQESSSLASHEIAAKKPIDQQLKNQHM